MAAKPVELSNGPFFNNSRYVVLTKQNVQVKQSTTTKKTTGAKRTNTLFRVPQSSVSSNSSRNS